ncbi:Interferon-activable protein 205-B [Lemmus lemmus]
MNNYKKIVLLKGLERVSEYQFRTTKSLLGKELNLTEMQGDYDRIQISDLMEEKYPEDAGLDKLIEVYQSIDGLKYLVKELKAEIRYLCEPHKSKSSVLVLPCGLEEAGLVPVVLMAVNSTQEDDGGQWIHFQKRKTMNEEKPEVKKTKMSKGSDCPASPGEATVRCQTPGPQISSSTLSNSSLAKNQKTQTPSQSATRGAVGQNDAMTVKVLSATEPFKYESKEHGENSMFHGTVATVSEYFHVKVFNINLKEKFTKGNVIIISNYVKFRGILEIKKDSFVVNADPKQKIEVPNKLIRRANETPKISDIHKGISGALFYGLFTLYKVILENLFFAFFFLTFLSQHLVYGHSILNAPDLIYTNTWNQIG